jgi:epoxyqueuosine reductase
MLTFTINWLAVAVSAIANLVVGGLWYGPLFGRPWMKELGLTMEDVESGPVSPGYLIAFVNSILMASFWRTSSLGRARPGLGAVGRLFAYAGLTEVEDLKTTGIWSGQKTAVALQRSGKHIEGEGWIMSPLSSEIIAKAESYPEIKAGIARLEDVLSAPSTRVVPEGKFSSSVSDAVPTLDWPPDAGSVLVLGLHHPEEDPQLDWWEGGVSPGDRRLMEISDALTRWLRDEHGIGALPLPYHADRGGVFLKDAAVLAGLGIIGRSNLLVNPQWGPRLRFRSLLLEGDLEPTGPLKGFSPCESCAELCHLACPRDAFSTGVYHRPTCIQQIDADVARRVPGGEVGKDGRPGPVVKYCRVCELACPVGT